MEQINEHELRWWINRNRGGAIILGYHLSAYVAVAVLTNSTKHTHVHPTIHHIIKKRAKDTPSPPQLTFGRNTSANTVVSPNMSIPLSSP